MRAGAEFSLLRSSALLLRALLHVLMCGSQRLSLRLFPGASSGALPGKQFGTLSFNSPPSSPHKSSLNSPRKTPRKTPRAAMSCSALLVMGLLVLQPSAALAADLQAIENMAHQQPERARQLAQRELQALPQTEIATRAQLQLILAEALVNLSLGEPALASAEAALAQSAQLRDNARVRAIMARAQARDLLGIADGAEADLNALLADSQFDSALRAELLMTRGMLATSRRAYSAALSDFAIAYRDAPDAELRFSKADIAAHLGNLYSQLRDRQAAIRYYRHALDVFSGQQNRFKRSVVAYSLSLLYMGQNTPDQAETYLRQALTDSEMLHDEQGIAYAQNGLAAVAIERGQWQQAEALLGKAISAFATAQNAPMQFEAELALAEVRLGQGHADDALRRLDAALKLQPQGSPGAQLARVLKLRARAYALLGQHQAAYQDLQRYVEEQARIQNELHDEALAELRVRYEVEREQQQNELLKRDNDLQARQILAENQSRRFYLAIALTASLAVLFLLFAIYKSRAAKQKLAELAATDELTGLANRRFFQQVANMEMERAHRHQLPMCIAVLDLDHFKAINDQYGHAAGDQVLQAFAQVGREVLRQTDVLARVGGEEFILLLPHTTLPQARLLLERMRARMGKFDARPLGIEQLPTVSMGLTSLAISDRQLADVIKRADDAVYLAKKNGRNRVELIEPRDAAVMPVFTFGSDSDVEKY